MTLRKSIKNWLYGSCPGFAGSFRYFGTRVYFPKGSLSFTEACKQGVFESDNLRILQSLVRPNTTYFDIGANIGLMAVPVLQHNPSCRVVSFEPSPNVLPYLQRTVAESAYRERWTLVPKAVSTQSGKVTFTLSDQTDSLFDGIRPTHRVASVKQVEVDMTTVDETWRALGSPSISAIKCDVEGGELDVLKGARECLCTTRPFILLEWNPDNLAAYECPRASLLNFARGIGCKVLSIPGLVEVHTEAELSLHMVFTENFLLCPAEES